MASKLAAEKIKRHKLPPLEKGWQTLDEQTYEKMEKLFNSALFLSVMERPFSDFPYLVSLQNKNKGQLGLT